MATIISGRKKVQILYMKKIFVSAGLLAAGAAGLQPALASGPDLVSPKAWNISASLRGFYDDNYDISGTKRGSFGAEFSPTISLNVPMQQTDFGLRYTYGLYYYQDRDALGLNPFDQSHQVNIWLDHAFNTRWKVNVSDTFAVGQEPELIGPQTGGNPVQYRVNGDNIANHATIKLDTEWTRQFSTSLVYGNSYYDYSNSGTTLGGPPSGSFNILTTGIPNGQPFFQFLSSGLPSLAGTLNRIEQNVSLDLQWHFQPETVGFVGYNLSFVNYLGNEPIGVFNYYALDVAHPGSLVYYSNSRDSLSHYAYVGVSHQFTANLSGTLKGGASYTDSYNDPLQTTTSISPYADLSVSYTYIPGSYVQLGFTHDINSTVVASVNAINGSMTQYAESSVIYASINHRFNPKLLGTIIGQCQYSTYQGGANASATDADYNFGINLSYHFTTHFSADLGYNFDYLQSNSTIPTYSRNRVYFGFGASY